MAKLLPAFAPLSLEELRRFWRKYRGNQDIERLVLEVQFSRNVIDDIDVYFLSIHRAWREQNVGELVAIEKVRVLLIDSIYTRRFIWPYAGAPRRVAKKVATRISAPPPPPTRSGRIE